MKLKKLINCKACMHNKSGICEIWMRETLCELDCIYFEKLIKDKLK